MRPGSGQAYWADEGKFEPRGGFSTMIWSSGDHKLKLADVKRSFFKSQQFAEVVALSNPHDTLEDNIQD